MTWFRELLELLQNAGVEFIVVGGVAAAAHGSPRSTLDVDVVYSRNIQNYERLANALKDHSPYLRGAPPGLPFKWDVPTLKRGLNFTLTTDIGDLDLLGEITGGGFYEDLLPFSEPLPVLGLNCRCINLAKLIEVKRAAGRPKDFEAVAELEAIQEELQNSENE